MSQPNILIFMTDHQRADTVLPEHPAITPNLDKFVAEGVTFTNTFCPTPHCCPSRATFFSGLYPSRSGVWNNVCNGQALSRGLNEGVRIWSEDVAEAGYDMRFSGKWHVSVETSPKDHGWNELFASGTGVVENETPWDSYRKIAEQPDPTERGEGEILRPGWGTYRTYSVSDAGKGADYKAHAIGMEALRDLTQDDDKPWCLYVGLNSPHDPYDVPQKYLDLYDIDDVALPASYADEMNDKPGIYQRMRRNTWGQLSEREVREGIRHFWAMCSELDDQFGQLLQVLEESGQADNTVVLYVSDHGDYCGDHGLFCKSIPCFRGAYNVPAVMRWPAGVVNPGRRVDAFVSLADFAPTFTELSGKTPDPDLTGQSLVPFLKGETPADWRDEIHTQCDGVELYFTQRSVTTKDFKFVLNGFDFDELYDLRNDPDEMRNVIDDPQYTDTIREMTRRMWKFAHKEQDAANCGYITIALAPHGPAEAFRSE